MQAKVNELIVKAEGLISELKEFVSGQNQHKTDRFKKLSDGWVLDKRTGLEWAPSSEKQMNFADAEKYAADKGGRLPAVRELNSLVDYARHEPATDTDFFPDTKSDWYWTSTPTSWNGNAAWCVGFYDGDVYNGNKDNYHCVRPVRASQCLII